jgi:hypothetical protein
VLSIDQRYTVTLLVGRRKLRKDVVAKSPHLAARLAEHSERDSVAVAVETQWEVVGRCGRCSAIVFAGERPRGRGNGIRCMDC